VRSQCCYHDYTTTANTSTDIIVTATNTAQVDEVLSACPAAAQRALFSATLGPKVKELASSVLRDPLSISVGTPNAGAATIDQKLVFVGREDGKLLAIRQVSGYWHWRYCTERYINKLRQRD
jgi:superfamily II DNA/RNA helicase